MSLSLVIPFFNEVDQIPYTYQKIKKLKIKIKNIEFIFVDDFSNDGSSALIKKYKTKDKNIRYIKNKKKGLGSAISTGILNSKKEYVCIYMCDESDDINDVIKYFKTINKNKKDAILGTRFSKESKIENYPLIKLFLNRIANNIIKIIFFSNYNDFTNACKIYRKKVLLELFPLVSESFNVFLEIPLKVIIRKYSYEIVPINWFGRKIGKSKFKIKELGSMYLFTLLYCLFEKILLRKNET